MYEQTSKTLVLIYNFLLQETQKFSQKNKYHDKFYSFISDRSLNESDKILGIMKCFVNNQVSKIQLN